MNEALAKSEATTVAIRRLISIEEASKYLAVSTWTVRRMIWSGAIPHVRRGRRILLDLRDLDQWIEREKAWGV